MDSNGWAILGILLLVVGVPLWSFVIGPRLSKAANQQLLSRDQYQLQQRLTSEVLKASVTGSADQFFSQVVQNLGLPEGLPATAKFSAVRHFRRLGPDALEIAAGSRAVSSFTAQLRAVDQGDGTLLVVFAFTTWSNIDGVSPATPMMAKLRDDLRRQIVTFDGNAKTFISNGNA